MLSLAFNPQLFIQSVAFASAESVREFPHISYFLFPCPSTKLLSESTVRVSSKCLPSPKFPPTVVCGICHSYCSRLHTHLPDAPRAAPAAASHLWLAELMSWLKDRHSAPCSTGRNTQRSPQPHFNTLSRGAIKTQVISRNLISTVALTKPYQKRANPFAASTSCVHSCCLAFAPAAYPTLTFLPQSGTFLCRLLSSVHPLSSRSASHPE